MVIDVQREATRREGREGKGGRDDAVTIFTTIIHE
jgi:hypothetical protein